MTPHEWIDKNRSHGEDMAQLIIEIKTLTNQTYNYFNERDKNNALFRATLLKAVAKELYEVIQSSK